MNHHIIGTVKAARPSYLYKDLLDKAVTATPTEEKQENTTVAPKQSNTVKSDQSIEVLMQRLMATPDLGSNTRLASTPTLVLEEEREKGKEKEGKKNSKMQSKPIKAKVTEKMEEIQDAGLEHKENRKRSKKEKKEEKQKQIIQSHVAMYDLAEEGRPTFACTVSDDNLFAAAWNDSTTVNFISSVGGLLFVEKDRRKKRRGPVHRIIKPMIAELYT